MTEVPAKTLRDIAGRGTARAMLLALCLAAAGTLVMLIGLSSDPSQFFRAYLAAWLWCLNVSLGSMALLLTYQLTGGAWGLMIRRLLEACMGTLPLMAIGFVPIALGAHYLYLWCRPEIVQGNELLEQQQGYMNFSLWCLRAAAYFAIWLSIALGLAIFSRRQDRGRNQSSQLRRTLSGLGLLVYGITIHFASLDWILSLEPAYHSTICGPLLASQQMLAALAFALLVFSFICQRPPIADFISNAAVNDLAGLLLTFVVVWSYMWWFEYMLTWIANLPSDVIWYGERTRGWWSWVAVLTALCGFVIPFPLLLQKAIKQRPGALASVAALILFAQLLFLNWEILPAFGPADFASWWMSLIAPVAIGGWWCALFVVDLSRRPVLPLHDPVLLTAMRLRVTSEWESQWEESLAHG